MEKSLKLFLSSLCILCFACEDAMSEKEKIDLAARKFKIITNQTDHEINLNQGSALQMSLLEEIIALNPKHCDALRERSIPYLKRGIPYQWKKYMDQAVLCDATRWQPWRGYLYLYFYRDYKKAIADFNASDSLTPNHIDAPQGHSVDYWRGHAYLGAKQYEKSLYYYQKHLTKVTYDFGEDWVEPETFLNMAIAHYENKSLDSMPFYLDKALHFYQNKSADSKYYYALYHIAKKDTLKALDWIDQGIEDFLQGFSKKRGYVEEIKQLYVEELIELEKTIKNPAKRQGL